MKMVASSDWPDGAPKWEPYLCWQIGGTDIECIEALKGFAAEEFEQLLGATPEFVFYRLRAIYTGPVRKE